MFERIVNLTAVRERDYFIWNVHVYTTGVLSVILTCVAFVHMILILRKKHTIPSVPLYVILTSLMTIFGLTRSLFFFVDGYNINEIFPIGLAYFFFHIGHPCLTSSFYLLLVTLYKVTRMRHLPRQIFSKEVIVVFVTLNFIFTSASDFVVAAYANTKLLLQLCGCYFIVVGIVMSIGFLIITFRLYIGLYKNRRMLQIAVVDQHKSCSTNMSPSTVSSNPSLNNVTLQNNHLSSHHTEKITTGNHNKMPMALRITICAAILYLLHTLLGMYNFLIPFQLGENEHICNWQWWVYQTIWRITELCMASVIMTVAVLPVYKNSRAANKAYITNT